MLIKKKGTCLEFKIKKFSLKTFLNNKSLWDKMSVGEIKKLVYPEEFESYLRLKEAFKNRKFCKEEVTLFYPGCGADVETVLLMLDAILDWEGCRKVSLIYADTVDVAPGFICSTIDRITARKNKVDYISDDSAQINFVMNGREITLTYFLSNVLERQPDFLKEGFDIYYERGFEIFRADEGWFAVYVLNQLKKGGLLVSDCGFCKQDLLREHGLSNFGPKELPQGIGFYKNFRIYRKK